MTRYLVHYAILVVLIVAARKAAADAKLPLVDLHLEKGDVAGDWSFQVSYRGFARGASVRCLHGRCFLRSEGS
jgi:hypothetical protein